MQHPDRLSVQLSQGPQRRQREAMIAPERHQLGLPSAARARRRGPTQRLERLRHLLLRYIIVKGRDRHVAAINHPGPALVRIDAGAGVEAAKGRLPSRRLSDGAGSETGTYHFKASDT